MHPNCIAEISAVLGRSINADEARAYESAMTNYGRVLARLDPEEWRTLTHAERVFRAAERAEFEAIKKAEKLAQRKASNLLAQTREAANLEERAPAMKSRWWRAKQQHHHSALFERMRQIENRISGEKHAAMGDIVDAVMVVEPTFLRLIENPVAVRDFAKEVFGETTDNKEAAKAAKAYSDASNGQRVRANSLGMDIGKLDSGYLPQPHDVGRIARVAKQVWVDYVMPLINRSKYVNEDGSLMTDPQLREVIHEVYDTLTTEGRNKLIPGKSGTGSRAAMFDEAHRVIHFKDADSHLKYLAEFGRGSMIDAITGHAAMMAKHIALMDEWGANPNTTYRLLKDTAEKLDNKAGGRESLATLDMVWNVLNGLVDQPVDADLAIKWRNRRNYVAAAKLQNIMLSSITDVATMNAAARFNGMSTVENMANVIKSFGGETKEVATRLGLATESITTEMAHWHTENLTQNWTSKLANTTMRLTFVEAWTHALRRGFGLTLSSTLGKLRDTDWHQLSKFDRERFIAAGIREQDWKIWQLAELSEIDGQRILTKDGLRAIPEEKIRALGLDPRSSINASIGKFLGFIDQEAHAAVLSPDLMTRAAITQGMRAGTLGGEMLRNLMFFKSFPMAMVIKQLRRLDLLPDNASRIIYSTRLLTSLTLMGALTQQLNQLRDGKDPRKMDEAKFWAAAFVQGGGIGVFGDVLYTSFGGNSRSGQANWTYLGGPVLGTLLDAIDVGVDVGQAVVGDDPEDDSKAGAKVLRFVKGNTPLVNLWYLRSMIDHLVFHDLQESISPGYLQSMEDRAQKDFDQAYWWRPGGSPIPGLNEAGEDFGPERAPNLQTEAVE